MDSSVKNIVCLSATDLAQAIRTRKITADEAVSAHLAQIEEVNPSLNALVQNNAKEALSCARAADSALAQGDIIGPLHGVPITVKDNFEVAGLISTAGSMGLASYVPDNDAVAVSRLRAAGAIVLGKTNMPELGLAHENG